MSVDRSDEALLALVAVGDEEALGEIYTRYARPIFSLALRMMHDPEAAENLTQEVFLKIWLHATSYHRERGARAGGYSAPPTMRRSTSCGDALSARVRSAPVPVRRTP